MEDQESTIEWPVEVKIDWDEFEEDIDELDEDDPEY